MMAVMPGLTMIAVAGESMLPTTGPGDWWLVLRSRRLTPGQLVACWHPLRVDLLIVKRVVRREGTGWWVEGDNPAASDDSRAFGAVPDDRIVGRLLIRYRRGPRPE